MKNIKLITTIILMLIVSIFTSCHEKEIEHENPCNQSEKSNDVTLHFNNTFGNTPIVLGQTEDTSASGQTYKFDELKYIISNVRLVNECGEVAYHTNNLDKGAFVINQADPKSCNVVLKDIPQGNYNKIKFGLGVKTELNELNQEKFPDFYAKTGGTEGNKEMKMHWYWAKGYRFLKIEGVYGSEKRKLSIHTGSTLVGAGKGEEGAYKQGLDAYREIELPLNYLVVGEKQSKLDIKADFHKLFSGKAHKITLVSGQGAGVTATPNPHSSDKMKDYLDNLGFGKQGIFSTKFQKDDVVVIDNPTSKIKPMITKWKTIKGKINGEEKDVIAINTRNGAKYAIKKDGKVAKEGVLDDDKKVTIDMSDLGAGEYIVELQPLTDDGAMVLYMGQVQKEEAEALLEISQWGNFKRGTTTYSMLHNCKNVEITAVDIPDFSEVTDMGNMFNGCSSIKDIPNISEWNVSNVTNMSNMFSGVYQFNSEIGAWNVSKVTNMTRMFAQLVPDDKNKDTPEVTLGKFNQDISKWDVSNVKTMNGMFRRCVEFNQDLSAWKITNVWNMEEMFKGAEAFNQDLSKWDTSKVNKFNGMFNGAKAFNQSLATFSLKSAYRSMSEMLDDCGMSCKNYDATLKAWADNEFTRKKGRKFSAKGLTYTDKASHDKLTSTEANGKLWKITGDIYDVNCK